MRRAKGGWKASYRDTWSLDYALGPIIAAGLKKFIEVKASKKNQWFGVPGVIAVDFPDTEEGFAAADALWDEILGKMLYAFDAREPDMSAYDFRLDMETIPCEDAIGFSRVEFRCSNDEEHERYNADVRAHDKKRAEGLRLFGQYYQSLWW